MELIVAVDRNWAIGRDGDQLAYLSEDLKRFRALTMGKTVILGRRTLATFPGGRPLRGRDNLILSTDPHFAVEGARVVHSVAEAVAAAPADAVVIGGASVYRALLPWCELAHVTRLDAAFEADCYFPNLDEDPAWQAGEPSPPMEQDGLCYRYVSYRRR
jgi:dihydrofolate reductase